MPESKPKATIKIPRPLYDRLRQVIEGSGFNSVTDFVVYVLRDIVSGTGNRVDTTLSREELEAIKKRLRNLGYL
ncbi:MAG: CopG family transcriptional regulator [Deltaproteobacteria bacterium]|nr:CopG family transcriptional regulator [Deltaproteobacteria bacterium]